MTKKPFKNCLTWPILMGAEVWTWRYVSMKNMNIHAILALLALTVVLILLFVHKLHALLLIPCCIKEFLESADKLLGTAPARVILVVGGPGSGYVCGGMYF